ncbi:MAG: Na(+)-translocating NADH-quinone reductase subunit A [Saprospiraceae bacterium]
MLIVTLRRTKNWQSVNNFNFRAVFTAVILFSSFLDSFAQSSDNNDSWLLSRGVVVLVILLLLGFVLLIAEKLLQIQAMRAGEKNLSQYSIFPQISKWFAKRPKSYVSGAPVIKLTKGYEISLNGEPIKSIITKNITRYAVNATDFRGLAPIPKVVVEVGEEVKAGDPLFFDKNNTEVLFVAPVSGEIIEVNRGDKRAITSIVILADKEIRHKFFQLFDLITATREQVIKYMCEGGVWPMIIERPFGTIADIHNAPENIFISTFDTGPFAPDANLVVKGKETAFQKGLDALIKLTGNKVHLGLNANEETAPSTAFTHAQGVEKHWFEGKHPAGNVGIQIHHIDPIKKGAKVWTLGVQEVISIGALFLRARHEADRTITLGGASLADTGYVSTYIGASIGDLISGVLKENSRLISGDVWSGKQENASGFIGYHDDQLTAIEEGNKETLFGWAIPRLLPSVSGAFPNKLLGDIKFDANTNTNGEPRAFVMTGQYEEMLPMNIYPQALMKAIITKDIERMEGLGIHELAEEDIALCEFACTSKQPLQSLLREGLNMIKEES